MPAPDLPAAPADLSDAEFAELDDLLTATPEPLSPMDVVMLDGFLCGLIVQPVAVEPGQWLRFVFDAEGRPLPGGAESAAFGRACALTLRRYTALNRALLEDGWFDPLILEDDDGTGEVADPAVDEPDSLVAVSEVSRPLLPWVAGFQNACAHFPALLQIDDEAVMSAIARLFRHLPAETDDERELLATFDRELPLATLDEAIEDLVAAVADLADLTRDERYRVDTVRRDAPKVGRNDPCPCGSGKKFKHCHGGD